MTVMHLQRDTPKMKRFSMRAACNAKPHFGTPGCTFGGVTRRVEDVTCPECVTLAAAREVRYRLTELGDLALLEVAG